MNFFSNKTNDKTTNLNIKLPWVEKYRPKNSDEILLEPFIKDKINKILETRIIPNMIITGEPGTGKTSTILFIAKPIEPKTAFITFSRGIRLSREDLLALALTAAHW